MKKMRDGIAKKSLEVFETRWTRHVAEVDEFPKDEVHRFAFELDSIESLF